MYKIQKLPRPSLQTNLKVEKDLKVSFKANTQ